MSNLTRRDSKCKICGNEFENEFYAITLYECYDNWEDDCQMLNGRVCANCLIDFINKNIERF